MQFTTISTTEVPKNTRRSSGPRAVDPAIVAEFTPLIQAVGGLVDDQVISVSLYAPVDAESKTGNRPAIAKFRRNVERVAVELSVGYGFRIIVGKVEDSEPNVTLYVRRKVRKA